MIALHAVNANAPEAAPKAAQLSGSGQSIISSDFAAQDFSALLTELVGPGAISQVVQATPTTQTTPANPNLQAVPTATVQDANTPKVQGAFTPEQLKTQAAPGPKKTDDSAKAHDTAQTNQTVMIPFPAVAVAATVMNDPKQFIGKSETDQTDKVIDATGTRTAANQTQTVMPQALTPEMQRAWADVKKFEFNVQTDASKAADTNVQPQVAPADLQKEATIVTTDPIANVQIQQLPPRITAIEKLMPEAKLAERAKPSAAHESSDSSTTASTLHFTDVTKSFQQVEQIRPAQPIEIPQTPHLQVVRTVAMEVGDADSQVTVRIQERAGDISLQINAASGSLHEDLQSSVGSLVHALRQEQVQVSNVDVSRKAPIEKVRRMKEAHS